MPILAFLFVFIISFALFSKTKIFGKGDTINFIVSILIAMMFLLNPAATKFTLATVPWIAVLMVVLLFILVILTFLRKDIDELVKRKVVAFIIVSVVLLVFLAAAVNVFGPLIVLLSGGDPGAGSPALNVLLTPAVVGAAIILLISAITYFLLTGGSE